MSKHTPGPWRYGRHIDGYRSIDADGWNSLALVIEFDEDDNADPEGIANAFLIAAAPDLYEALEELLDIEGPQPGTAAWADKTRALIAKAKGEV